MNALYTFSGLAENMRCKRTELFDMGDFTCDYLFGYKIGFLWMGDVSKRLVSSSIGE